MYAGYASQGDWGMEAGTPPTDMTATVISAVKDIVNPVLGVAVALATAAIAYLTAKLKTVSEEKIALQRQEMEAAHNAELAKIQRADSETNQFAALLSGYKQHVDQLTAEVHALRTEVTNLRAALSARLNMCSGCDRFAEWQQNFAEIARSLEPPRGSGL